MSDTNNRETGARKLEPHRGSDPSDAFSQKAAENNKPRDGMGLTRPIDETDEKTRQSDGREPRKQ